MKKNQLYLFFVLALALQLPGLFALAQEPVVAYATIEGARSGQIKGSSTNNMNAGKIECIGFMFSEKSPRDAASGMASGKMQPGSIIIVKHIDVASPLLMQAFTTNEDLTNVTIELYRQSGDGKMMAYQTVKLTNAGISQITQYAGTLAPVKVTGSALVEELTLTAQKIDVESPGGNTASTGGSKVIKGTSSYDIKANKKQ
ncbi:MAG: type VI secretion system tube protein Hcp [Mucilaginibacter sp.]